MKKILLLSSLIFIVPSIRAQVNYSESMSLQFTERMKDSVHITKQQSVEINSVNQFLAREKLILRQQISHPDSLQRKTQQVENMRDSLYKKILSSEQYIIYKKKKRFLIGNR